MAYSGTELRPAAECETLVTGLLDHAEAGAQWLTNATMAPGSVAWASVSPDWTFDIAYAAAGET